MLLRHLLDSLSDRQLAPVRSAAFPILRFFQRRDRGPRRRCPELVRDPARTGAHHEQRRAGAFAQTRAEHQPVGVRLEQIEHFPQAVLFGHSLGALICFELALRLRDKHGIEPGLLIVSGRGAPQIPSNAAPTYNLPDRELINELQRLNGTPREVLDHPELMELMLPKIRADFQISETYNFVKKPPLNCPITVMGGADDQEVPRDSLEAWNEHTKGRFTLHVLPGDHFMIHSAEAAVVNLVNHDLRLMTANSGNMPE